MGHVRLVHAPAEEDDLTAPATGEIHEARVQVLHLATKSLDIFEGALEGVGLFPQAGVPLLLRLFAEGAPVPPHQALHAADLLLQAVDLGLVGLDGRQQRT